MTNVGCVTITKTKPVRSLQFNSASAVTLVIDNVVNSISELQLNYESKNLSYSIEQLNNTSIIYINSNDISEFFTSDSREEIWSSLFDSPLPSLEEDAVTKYAGSLTVGEGMDDEEILAALDDS